MESLLARMTLEEKVGQMTQLTIDTLHRGQPMKLELPPVLDEEKLDRIIRREMVGSILNVPTGHLPDRQEWLTLVARIQAKAQETRLQIPVLYGIDAIHGVNYCRGATLFPQPIAQAATFDPDLSREIARATAYECRAAGLPWNFSPALDVGRHPAWPRLWESFGEDVYLNAILGEAVVEGYQGPAGAPDKVAACLKHFTGYGQPISGMDRTPAWIPERYLREYYLPAYQRAIDAGALSIMVNSGEINGIPVHAHTQLLTDILRGEMGFNGVLVTDWWDIVYLHERHRVAATPKEAVRMAIEAGIDMSMTPFDTEFKKLLIALVREGKISENRIDTSVRRILRLKEHLGLFTQNPIRIEDYPKFGSTQFHSLSRKAARESIVLLKNDDQLLPLPATARLLVCGPAADTQRALNGGWTADWQGQSADEALSDHPTILKAIERQCAGEVIYRQGVSFTAETDFREAIWKAQEADYIILCLGEDSYTEDEGNIQDLYLDERQTNLALALAETGKPIVGILAAGRPRLISRFADRISAIIGAFYPGPHGGEALAEMLFGRHNPSGKLPFTYPKYPNALLNYDHKYTEDRILDRAGTTYDPQFPFGHGLSYTTFAYQKLTTDKKQHRDTDPIRIEVSVKNVGDRPGSETVLLYISDLYASITPPVKRLRGFQKIRLAPGERKQVTFELQPSELAFVGKNNQWILEPGTFRIRIGGLKRDFDLIS